ncbi:carbon storage regulator [Sinanaerobacter chloroacetimidivorans]|uniref:Translational regulator CsrA n=1 Tax=Sinanaerobacter chloroacetimidivorans TaxID=2818044 RepID=A0A8J8B0E4_9FIRM|nr:carbon storage regulator [Sinanaerobacter chloroacetimidivorans]MBR0597518.1 carbon storage regulator [Sinanaerobacter chloroacetimidivorans]
MLVISRKPGETLVISENIRITVLSSGNDKVTIGIDAPRDVKIVRQELVETIEANRASAEKIDSDNIKNIANLIKNNKKIENND